nr:MAG TPA: hypothetical protein [Caudoviricetes sp.]
MTLLFEIIAHGSAIAADYPCELAVTGFIFGALFSCLVDFLINR